MVDGMDDTRPDLINRHPSVRQVAQFFTFEHLPDHLRPVSEPCARLADEMVEALDDGPELTAGLRKLLEAKDCFVRAALTKDDVGVRPAG